MYPHLLFIIAEVSYLSNNICTVFDLERNEFLQCNYALMYVFFYLYQESFFSHGYLHTVNTALHAVTCILKLQQVYINI